MTFLEKTNSYTLHKPARHKYRRRMVTSPCLNNLWQADLIILDKLARWNNGYKYLLVTIDALSRFARVVPLKRKTGEEVSKAFSNIFRTVKCNYLQCDFGKEFYCKDVDEVFTRFGVKKFSTYSDTKACVAERLIRSIMMKIQKYLTHFKTKRYIDVLPKLIKSYNGSVHRSINVSPSNVNERNQMQVWFQSFKKMYSAKKQSPSFAPSNLVRIKINKGVFEKGYKQTFSDKIYTISEVLKTVPIVYKLSDENGLVLGSFYEDELCKVLLEDQ